MSGYPSGLKIRSVPKDQNALIMDDERNKKQGLNFADVNCPQHVINLKGNKGLTEPHPLKIFQG